MTRRLYRLYFNERPPVDIWNDNVQAHNNDVFNQRRSTATPPTLKPTSDRRLRIDSEPTKQTLPEPNFQHPHRQHHQHHHSQRKLAIVKKEPDENNSSSSQKSRNSVNADAASTPVRRTTIDTSRSALNVFPEDAVIAVTSSSGRRLAASKRPHQPPTHHANSWAALSPYGPYRPALRRRRISHEGLLLIVPIVNSSSAVKIAGTVRGSAESYGVDTPFQVYMSVFDTVRQLKEKIWSEKGVPINRQVIWISDNAVMNESQKLGDLGVAVGDLDNGLGSNSEGKDVIGLQVIKDIKIDHEDKAPPRKADGSPAASASAASNHENKTT